MPQATRPVAAGRAAPQTAWREPRQPQRASHNALVPDLLGSKPINHKPQTLCKFVNIRAIRVKVVHLSTSRRRSFSNAAGSVTGSWQTKFSQTNAVALPSVGVMD